MENFSLDLLYNESLKTERIVTNYSQFIKLPHCTNLLKEIDINYINQEIDEILSTVLSDISTIKFLKEDALFPKYEKELKEKKYFKVIIKREDEPILFEEEFLKCYLSDFYKLQLFFLFNYIFPLIDSLSSNPLSYNKLFSNFLNELEDYSENNILYKYTFPLTKEEFYYSLLLLNDDLLRDFLEKIDKIEELYKIVINRQKDEFIKEISKDFKNINYREVLFYFMADPKNHIFTKVFEEIDDSKKNELMLLTSFPLFLMVRKLKEVFFQQESSYALENKLDIIKTEFINLLSYIKNDFLQEDYIPKSEKYELNERLNNVMEVFKITIPDNFKNEEMTLDDADKITIYNLIFQSSFEIMKEKILELQIRDKTYDPILPLAEEFIRVNFSFKDKYTENKFLKDFLDPIALFLSKMKDIIDLYSFAFLLFPDYIKSGRYPKSLIEGGHLINGIQWKVVEPPNIKSVVNKILNAFPNGNIKEIINLKEKDSQLFPNKMEQGIIKHILEKNQSWMESFIDKYWPESHTKFGFNAKKEFMNKLQTARDSKKKKR